MIAALIRTAIMDLIDQDKWMERTEQVKESRRIIGLVAENWDDVARRLEEEG